jgi:D-alanine-D-alanine ligase
VDHQAGKVVAMNERIPVVVLFGGVSTEHEISCLTAGEVIGAIDLERFEPHGLGIDAQGHWHRYQAAEIAELKVVDGVFPTVSPDLPEATLHCIGGHVELATIDEHRLVDPVRIQVALPLLHGPFGEDGTIQGLFEMIGLRYAGSGVAASAIGMDKQFMKQAFQAAGLNVGPYVVLTSEQWLADKQDCLNRCNDLTYPLYVKPARGGSSVGITRITEPAQLESAIEGARIHDPKVIIEQAITGAREIECAVLGPRDGGPVRTSRIGEIVVKGQHTFYDYQAKYVDPSGATLLIHAEIDPVVEDRVRQVAAQTFAAVGAEGLARVDTFVLPDGQVIVNEINTMPGFTSISMFPSLWQAAGMSYSALVSDLLDQALSRPTGLR